MRKIALALGLLVLPSTLSAQNIPLPGPVEDAEVWCINNEVCNPASHLVIGTGITVGISQVTGMEARDARWITAGVYVGKEVKDIAQWGVSGHEVDIALDIVMDAAAWWVAPRVNDWLHGGEDD